MSNPPVPAVAADSAAPAPQAPRPVTPNTVTTDAAGRGGNPFDALVAEYDQWLRGQDLPNLCAEELLHEDLTAAQRRWLSDYVLRWEERERFVEEREAAFAAAEAEQWGLDQ